VVESPESTQPELPHAGSNNAVPLMSWPSAMKVFAAVCGTAVLGDETGVLEDAGGVLGAVEEADVATVVVGVIDADEAAELADELHAVTSKAAQPSAAHAATCLARFEFAVHMISNPFNSVSGSASHVTSTTPAAPPRLQAAVRRRHHFPFGINITAGGGAAIQGTERTWVISRSTGPRPGRWARRSPDPRGSGGRC
jgi:hypothetical protein